MSTPDQLLTIKLFVPPVRPGQVDRPRLLQKLDQGLLQGRKLSLISAPAGYGKTTLVVEWLHNLDRPFAWLSVERSDNHPVQFITYLVTALQQVDPAIGRMFLTALASADPREIDQGWLRAQLPILVNEINQTPAPFVLVLDDYHTINDLSVHEALGFILDHQPPQMHLVIITRQDPLLPLSRQRSRGQVTEIRMTELRFSRDEAAEFFYKTMCLELAQEEITSLQTRTEGWIAGLQLAAISLSEISSVARVELESRERAEFIRAFAGDDHLVMDYLVDEVLSRLPGPIQQFLLYTSILKRLCSSLCDELITGQVPGADMVASVSSVSSTGSQASFGSSSPSQAILEYLEKANIFLIPLDNHRRWFRYHHLFADLLSARLQAAHPGLLTDLHCRASRWLEKNGFTAEAIDHALLAEDFDRALGLIEHEAHTSIWANGDLPALLSWVKRLPEEVVRTRPRLCLYCARGLFFAGQIPAAESYLREAARVLETRPSEDPDTAELRGVLYTNMATFAAMQGETQTALDFARQAYPLLPADDPSTEARVLHAIGMAEYLSGRMNAAEQAFAKAVSLAKSANNRNLGSDVAACQALSLLSGGHAQRSRQTCEQALAEIGAGQAHPSASAIYIAYGEILYAQNELGAAVEALETGLELGRKANWPHVQWRGFAILSAVKSCQGDAPGAQEALRRFEQVAQRYNNPAVNQWLEPWKMRLALHLGHLETAVRWADSCPPQPRAETLREFQDLTLARILLAQGKPAEAQAILSPSLISAETGERGQGVIEALILRAMALKDQGKIDAALDDLIRALKLAEPEGFARLFLDQIDPLSDLLRQAHRGKIEPSTRNFTDKLLATLELNPLPNPVFRPGTAAPLELVEPLSEREMEVLRLIADGLSNPEIAARLFLSVNTLRAHSSHILAKLDVHSRGQAVAKARDLGILPR